MAFRSVRNAPSSVTLSESFLVSPRSLLHHPPLQYPTSINSVGVASWINEVSRLTGSKRAIVGLAESVGLRELAGQELRYPSAELRLRL